MNAHRAIAFVDGHVHLHDCFDVDTFLDAAASNFAVHAHSLGAEPSFAGILMMTESSGHDRFRALAETAGRAGGSRWQVRSTNDDLSLTAEREGFGDVALIAGRQIVTREDLEVLALGSDRRFADGRDCESTIHEVLDHGAVAVVPWGFGKWSMRRREILSKIIDSIERPGFFLGDNAGRPSASFRPGLFDVAADRKIWTLPGSDPLPFPSQVDRVARYAFVLDTALDPDEPSRGLREAMVVLEAQPAVVGKLEGIGSFCFNQLRMQIRKRVG